MKKVGSQVRETLVESGYTFVRRIEKGTIVLRHPDGQEEYWYANDHHAGYTIQVGRWGYEYGMDVR